jgi:malonate-semialdehyde dehydrogenase (acetylating)/methylmalonate-semialdehyde dehydrogenase
VLNVVHGGKDVVDAICTHPDIKAISFVGSTAVGTHVYNLGSQHGKRVQSMMGAKNHASCCPTRTASRRSTRWSARASARPASAAWRLGGGAGRQARDWLPDSSRRRRR